MPWARITCFFYIISCSIALMAGDYSDSDEEFYGSESDNYILQGFTFTIEPGNTHAFDSTALKGFIIRSSCKAVEYSAVDNAQYLCIENLSETRIEVNYIQNNLTKEIIIKTKEKPVFI